MVFSQSHQTLWLCESDPTTRSVFWGETIPTRQPTPIQKVLIDFRARFTSTNTNTGLAKPPRFHQPPNKDLNALSHEELGMSAPESLLA